jgi:peptidase M28-like protein
MPRLRAPRAAFGVFPAAGIVVGFAACFAGGLSAQTARPATGGPLPLTPEMRIVSAHITANSLRGNLSFLASDLLEGRDTPSRGLDIAGEYIAAQFRKLDLEPAGGDGYFQTVTLYPDREDSPQARNVAGILRGSDPKLKETYVMLSSHYDHIGMAPTGDDRIFNGANDDGSGTVSVMEVAAALASLHPRPKRSVLFILFCGEEKGLRGSRYYAAHPLVPLAKTIAHLNLEQVGRTDATEGMKVGVANVTGFDFSSMIPVLVDAGRRAGVKILKDEMSSDKYFNRSDNGPIARTGIPAHTLSVAYDFPDYHGTGDEWQKIDYDNMSKVDQAVGIAMLNLASTLTPPKWNANYPAAQQYIDAAKKLAEP